MPYKMRRDDEAPEDKLTGTEPATEDVEGHARRRDEGLPTEKQTGSETQGDEVEGHARRRTAGTDADQDVEAHRRVSAR